MFQHKTCDMEPCVAIVAWGCKLYNQTTPSLLEIFQQLSPPYRVKRNCKEEAEGGAPEGGVRRCTGEGKHKQGEAGRGREGGARRLGEVVVVRGRCGVMLPSVSSDKTSDCSQVPHAKNASFDKK